MINSLPFFLWVKSGNISRKFLTFILKIFDKNFERLQWRLRFLLVMGEKCGKILKRKDIMSTSEFQAHRSARDCIRRSAGNHGRLLTWKNGKKYFKKGRE